MICGTCVYQLQLRFQFDITRNHLRRLERALTTHIKEERGNPGPFAFFDVLRERFNRFCSSNFPAPNNRHLYNFNANGLGPTPDHSLKNKSDGHVRKALRSCTTPMAWSILQNSGRDLNYSGRRVMQIGKGTGPGDPKDKAWYWRGQVYSRHTSSIGIWKRSEPPKLFSPTLPARWAFARSKILRSERQYAYFAANVVKLNAYWCNTPALRRAKRQWTYTRKHNTSLRFCNGEFSREEVTKKKREVHKRLKRFLNSLLSHWSNFALSQGQRRTAFKHGQ